MNHDKFPSMQMNQKSKHNNSGFKKWMQILAGEELFWSKNRTPNWNSATKKKTTAGNPAAERKSLCPAKKKPSPRGRGEAIATTNMSRQLQLRHFSLPLYSIQFLCKCIGTKYRNYNANEADEETELQTPLADALRKCLQRQCIPGSLQSTFRLCSSM